MTICPDLSGLLSSFAASTYICAWQRATDKWFENDKLNVNVIVHIEGLFWEPASYITYNVSHPHHATPYTMAHTVS